MAVIPIKCFKAVVREARGVLAEAGTHLRVSEPNFGVRLMPGRAGDAVGEALTP